MHSCRSKRFRQSVFSHFRTVQGELVAHAVSICLCLCAWLVVGVGVMMFAAGLKVLRFPL